MLASRSIPEHLIRGVLGVGAVVAGFALAPHSPLFLFVGLAVAVIAFRGCPICWTYGFYQTCRVKRPPSDTTAS